MYIGYYYFLFKEPDHGHYCKFRIKQKYLAVACQQCLLGVALKTSYQLSDFIARMKSSGLRKIIYVNNSNLGLQENVPIISVLADEKLINICCSRGKVIKAG